MQHTTFQFAPQVAGDECEPLGASEAAVAIPRAAVLRACGEQDGRGSGTESVPDCEQSMSQSEVLGGRRRWGGQLWRAPCCAHECAWMHLHA